MIRLLAALLPDWFRAQQLQRFREQSRFLNGLARICDEDPVLRVGEYQGVFAVDARSDLFRRLVIFGHYEPQVAHVMAIILDELRKRNTDGFDAVDIGANIGFHSVFFLKAGARRCLALEPVPSAHARLIRNLDRNEVLPQAIALGVAATDAEGMTIMEVIDGMEEYSAIGSIAHDAVADLPRRQISVPTRRLDGLVAEWGMEPHLIKIDAEGSEMAALRGAEATLRTFQPVLILECNSVDGTHPAIPWLSGMGYRFLDPCRQRWLTPGKPLEDVIAMPPSMSDFDLLAALLERR